MNPNTGEIIYGDADVIDRHGKEHGVHMVPVPENMVSELNNMTSAQRKEWAHANRPLANRPSLDAVVESEVDLTTSQNKALEKKERKRKLRLQQIAQTKG